MALVAATAVLRGIAVPLAGEEFLFKRAQRPVTATPS
jgi:hypothetical protein